MRQPNVITYGISHKNFLKCFREKKSQCPTNRQCVFVRSIVDKKTSDVICLGVAFKVPKRTYKKDVFRICILKRPRGELHFNCFELFVFKRALSFMWNLHKRKVV